MSSVTANSQPCAVCGEVKKCSRNNGVITCTGCSGMQAKIKKYPEAVLAEVRRLHPDLQPVSPSGAMAAELSDAEVYADQLRCANEDLSTQLMEQEGRVEDMSADLDSYGELVAALRELTGEPDDYPTGLLADRVRAMLVDGAGPFYVVPSIHAGPESPAGGFPCRNETEECIQAACMSILEMLIAKNRSYGNSALEPMRVFSRASAGEQLLVRIDDKLSRLAAGVEFTGEDTVRDLIGYLILLLVFRMKAEG